jgi:hypothetical protein
MLSAEAVVIIWDEMFSSEANIIIWSKCCQLVLSSDVIIWDIFPENFTYSI